MNRPIFNQQDVQKLDSIIDLVLKERRQLRIYDFKDNEIITETKDKERKLEFSRLLSIIENYDAAKITRGEANWDIIEANINTQIIKSDGGFKSIFQKELGKTKKLEEKEQLEIDLTKSNLEANELNKLIAAKNHRNERKNAIGMWVNISIGVLNIVLIAIQIWLSSQKT